MSTSKGENKTSPIKFRVDNKSMQINSAEMYVIFGHNSYDSLV